MKNLTLTLIATLMIFSFAFSQTTNQTTSQTTQKKTRPAQVTFFYPIGTNGITSYNYSNNVSLNWLFGLNGGVEGIELAGLFNINNGDVTGLQASGLFNITKGNTAGLQTAGLFNANMGNAASLQTSGIFNFNLGELEGIQTSGIFNSNIGNTQGIQVSGILNSNVGEMQGIQGSGILNSNVGEMQGIQGSGILNVNVGQLTGGQISGILNVVTDSLTGFQIGLVNYATQSEGVQVGLVNISAKKSENLLPIGLINIVNGGLQELEISGGDAMYANLNFKLGVPKFYTIFKAGYTSFNGEPILSSGIGVGSEFNIKNNHKINIDLSSNTLSDLNFETYNFNDLNKLDVNYKYALTKNFSVFAGPSFNILISQSENTILNPPYTIHKKTYNNTDFSSWVGLNIGTSVRL